MSSVCLVRCESYQPGEVEHAVRAAVDAFGGMSKMVRPGDRVLLKPNLLAARAPERRITTDPEVVRAVARLVIEAGGTPVVGDSPGLGAFKRVADKTGMSQAARDMGIDLVELTHSTPVTVPDPAVYRKIEIASEAVNADVVINLPKLKTHSQMLLTLGVKNLFGVIVAQRKAEWHHMAGVSRDVFASLHLDIYRTVRPALTILDGVWGMEGHGPSNGTLRQMNMIAAAADTVALDVGICHLLGIPLRTFPLYRAARARGIGETDVSGISFTGESPHAFSLSNFAPPNLDSLDMVPSGLDWFTKRFLVSKPRQDPSSCAGCGQCIEMCPSDAIRLEGTKAHFDYHRCIRCYCCQEICPEAAIRFHKGLLVRTLHRMNR